MKTKLLMLMISRHSQNKKKKIAAPTFNPTQGWIYQLVAHVELNKYVFWNEFHEMHTTTNNQRH